MTHDSLPLRPGDLTRLVRCSIVWLEGIGHRHCLEAEYGDLMLVLAIDADVCSVLLLTADGRVGRLRRLQRDDLTAWVVRV